MIRGPLNAASPRSALCTDVLLGTQTVRLDVRPPFVRLPALRAKRVWRPLTPRIAMASLRVSLSPRITARWRVAILRCPLVASRQRTYSSQQIMSAPSPATIPHTGPGTTGFWALPRRLHRQRFALQHPASIGVLCTGDARFSSPRLLRSPLSALPASRSVFLQTACQQPVDHLLRNARAPAPPPAGRPEAGQPSAEPKPFGS